MDKKAENVQCVAVGPEAIILGLVPSDNRAEQLGLGPRREHDRADSRGEGRASLCGVARVPFLCCNSL